MHKHGCPGATPVSHYPESQQRLRTVSTSEIIAVLRADNIRFRAANFGFTLEHVGRHSLRSGGAMYMHITGGDRLHTNGHWPVALT